VACLLAGIGTGWILPQLLGPSPEHHIWFLSSFAAAAILVLGAFAIQRTTTQVRRKQRETLRRGIDLADVQKSLMHYGYQPPIIQTSGLKSQLLKISRRTEIPNTAPLVLIEHHDGADMFVRCEGIQKDYLMQGRQMVRVDFAPGDINRQITFLPMEESGSSTGYILVHFIANE
jgi:hypothetical protein